MWAWDGLADMTGYPKPFANRQTPSFCREKNTSGASKDAHQSKNLQKILPFPTHH